MKDLYNYNDLLAYLQKMSKKQLQQPIQIVEPSPFPIKNLQPALAIGTVAQMEFYGCRSTVDNKYHADEVVILSDHPPFGEDGAIAYEGFAKKAKPIYGKNGKTKKKDQLAPPMKLDEDFEAGEIKILKNRMKGLDEIVEKKKPKKK